MRKSRPFDVVAIGGGHAGSEVCAAAARTARTALITLSRSNIGVCSCNPSIGGIGKGTVIREIDTFDGVAGKVADKACIQYRGLNASRGPAVWGPRAQIDRSLYRKHMLEELSSTPNLMIIGDTVEDMIVDKEQTSLHPIAYAGKIVGVRLDSGNVIPSSKIWKRDEHRLLPEDLDYSGIKH